MARRRITPLTQNGINPAAANVPSVMAAAMAVSANANLVNTNVYGVANPMTRDGKRRTPSGNGNLTNHQRKLICEFYQRSGSVMSQKDLAQWTKHEFGLKKTPAQSTISGILRRQHEFINMSSLELGIKKRRVVQHPELDNALANWVIQCAHRGINVQGDTTKEKAKHFAKMLGIPEEEQPEFSNGWLHSFQLRHNFSFRKFHGDTTSPTTSEKKKQVIKFTTLDALMEEARAYELRNVFCMSEMGLLYNLYPSTNTHIEQDRRATKRFVVALACNADGSEKLQPLFVSHLEQPISFQQKTPEQHGLQYFHNPHAWMSGVIFSKWLQRLDFAMGSQKRTILLILHETRSHAVAHLELHHVVVYFIPESMTTLNPMTTDLLSTLKLNYRRHHLRHVLRKAETTTPDGIVVDSTKLCFQTHLLQAFAWMRQCWRELKPLTIERSWSMTQIVADRLPMRPELQMNQEEVAFEAEVTHLLCCLNVPQCMTLNELMTAEETLFENSIHEEFFEVVHTTDPVPDDEVDENDLVVMSTTTTEANGQTGLNPSNNLRDANAGVTETATTAANLSLQDKLKAFRDVLQVLQTRNDSDDSALTALRRVQDAIRNEAQEHISAHVDVLHPMLQNQSTHMAMSMVEMNMDPSTVGSSAILRQQVNNALEMVPTTDSEFHTVI